jgi:O2-independent ubiquinone biosynthesis accessory factor UbiT
MKPDKKKAFPKPPSPVIVANKIVEQFARKLTKNLPKVIKQLPEPPFFLQKKLGEKLLKTLMAEQIEMGEFDFLQDKWLKLCVNDMGLAFFLTFQENKLQLSNQITEADVSFSGDSKEFILLASRTEDPDTLFFQRRLSIEGDTELGLYIKNSIDGIDFDSWPVWLNQSIKKIASFVEDIDDLQVKDLH